MAKKNAAQEESYNEESYTENGEENEDVLGVMDFDVNDEYKPEPLIPAGTYHGLVQNVTFNGGQYCIVWAVQLQDNGGFMSDDETPIDGATVYFRNWLPKPGDENEYTKSGRSTKRQSKINMMKDFQTQMGIDMSKPSIIAKALQEAEWVGLEVDCEVTLDEYQGKFRNSVNRMRPSA